MYTHLGVETNVDATGSCKINVCAEVGLLSRNIRIVGSNDTDWAFIEKPKACPIGFQPGKPLQLYMWRCTR